MGVNIDDWRLAREIENVVLCETFGWTLNQVKELTEFDRLLFLGYLDGKNKARN